MTSDWENEPGFDALKEEFVLSFVERRRRILEALANWGAVGSSEIEKETALAIIQREAHKLAGSAASYGFDALTDAARALEEWLGEAARGGAPDIAALSVRVAPLAQMLEKAITPV
jgi:HPt (histidine-containing phosphotransfer) domain-containing protein